MADKCAVIEFGVEKTHHISLVLRLQLFVNQILGRLVELIFEVQVAKKLFCLDSLILEAEHLLVVSSLGGENDLRNLVNLS